MSDGERPGARRRQPHGPPTAAQWRPVEYGDDGLIEGLEPDQLAEVAAQPVPPAALGGGARVALWGLRLFTIVVGVMVIYTFVYETIHG